MGHFAKVVNGVVVDVITADYDVIDTLPDKELWVRTSFNTHGGQHSNPRKQPLRMNYAGIGYTFDPSVGQHGAFIPPQPFPSWALNPATCLWEPPTPYPQDGVFRVWNEATTSWVEPTP